MDNRAEYDKMLVSTTREFVCDAITDYSGATSQWCVQCEFTKIRWRRVWCIDKCLQNNPGIWRYPKCLARRRQGRNALNILDMRLQPGWQEHVVRGIYCPAGSDSQVMWRWRNIYSVFTIHVICSTLCSIGCCINGPPVSTVISCTRTELQTVSAKHDNPGYVG